MIEGIVISLEILVIEMGDRGSKSVIFEIIVKEQRVDGSFIILSLIIRHYLKYNDKVYSSRRETGSWEKLSNSRLKIPQ